MKKQLWLNLLVCPCFDDNKMDSFFREFPDEHDERPWGYDINITLRSISGFRKFIETVNRIGLRIDTHTESGKKAWLATVADLHARGEETPWEVLTHAEFCERFKHLADDANTGEETWNNRTGRHVEWPNYAEVGGVRWEGYLGSLWVCSNEKRKYSKDHVAGHYTQIGFPHPTLCKVVRKVKRS